MLLVAVAFLVFLVLLVLLLLSKHQPPFRLFALLAASAVLAWVAVGCVLALDSHGVGPNV